MYCNNEIKRKFSFKMSIFCDKNFGNSSILSTMKFIKLLIISVAPKKIKATEEKYKKMNCTIFHFISNQYIL